MDELKGLGKSLLVLDAGDMLFRSYRVSRKEEEEVRLKADVMAAVQLSIGIDAINVGYQDLAMGIDYLDNLSSMGLPLISSNIVLAGSETYPFLRYKVFHMDGIRVGVFGLASNRRNYNRRGGTKADFDVQDPLLAAQEMVKVLRGDERAKMVIALSNQGINGDKVLAQEVPGIDLIFSSHDQKVLPQPIKVKASYIFQVGDRGKYLGVLDIEIKRGSIDFAPGDDRHQVVRKLTVLESQEKIFEGEIADDPDVKLGLVSIKKEKTALEKRLKELGPEKSTLINKVITITPAMPERQDIINIVERYKAKLAILTNTPPVAKVPELESQIKVPKIDYVGTKKCAKCHKKAFGHWESTEHALAWRTLIDSGDDKNPECIGCHSVGFRVPGGFDVVDDGINRSLTAVGCEACHGPGGKHKSKKNIIREVPEKVCKTCHTIDRSPGFVYAERVLQIRREGVH